MVKRKKRSYSIPDSPTVRVELNYENVGKELSTNVKLNNEIGKVKFENSTCH